MGMLMPLCKGNKDIYVLCISGVILVVCPEAGKARDIKPGNRKSNSSLCPRCWM